MNQVIRFAFDGKPQPQERPFVTRFGTFDRKKSKRSKAELALVAKLAAERQKWEFEHGPVTVQLRFINPHKRADIDNLIKLVLDALSGVLWEDDKLVTKIFAQKESGADKPQTIIWVSSNQED